MSLWIKLESYSVDQTPANETMRPQRRLYIFHAQHIVCTKRAKVALLTEKVRDHGASITAKSSNGDAIFVALGRAKGCRSPTGIGLL